MSLKRTDNTETYYPAFVQADFSKARGLTFAASFKVQGEGYHSNERIIWALGDGSDRPVGGLLSLGGSFNHLRFIYNFDGVGNVSIDAPNIPIQLDTFYGVAATIDAGGRWKMFLDGEVVALGISEPPLLVGPNPKIVPMARDSAWASGPGLIGELGYAGIWKRSFGDKAISKIFDGSPPKADLVFESGFVMGPGSFKAADLGAGWVDVGTPSGNFTWV
jgi:hypothetical protein